MKIPFISRKKHESAVAQLRLTIAHNNRQYDSSIEKLSKELDDFLPKLFRINLSHDSKFKTYKLQVEFCDEFIYEGFIHGNSQDMIHHIANRLSKSIERELMTINFARFK